MTSLSKAWRTEKSVWTAFEQICWIKGVKFSCSERSIPVKKWILSRKHDALQIEFQALLNEILELKLSNLFVETILEMSDSSSEGLISVKKWLLSRKHDVLQIQFEALLNQVN